MVRWRNNLLALNVVLLLVFNYGYVQLRVPQAQVGVPISEWLLLLSLLTIAHGRVLGRMRDDALLLPYVSWLVYGAVLIALSYLENGFRALRDGLDVIEAFFLYVGFVFAGSRYSLQRFAKWLPATFVVGFFYCLLYPLRDVLVTYSPIVTGSQGQPVYLLFYFVTMDVVLVAAAAYALDAYRHTSARQYLWFAAAALSMPLVFIPSRTLFLMLIALVAFFCVTGDRRLISGLAWSMIIGCVLFALILALGIEGTRLGLANLSDYGQLLLEIFPSDDPATFSSGTSERLEWWTRIAEQLASSWGNLLFGLGYGIPLTDLTVVGDVIVYTPHNTWFTIAARAGILGLVLFTWLMAIVVYRGFWVVRYLRKARRPASFATALLFIILTTLIVGIGEGPFDFPHFTVPYYFSAGILLRMYAIERGSKSHRQHIEPKNSPRHRSQ